MATMSPLPNIDGIMTETRARTVQLLDLPNELISLILDFTLGDLFTILALGRGCQPSEAQVLRVCRRLYDLGIKSLTHQRRTSRIRFEEPLDFEYFLRFKPNDWSPRVILAFSESDYSYFAQTGLDPYEVKMDTVPALMLADPKHNVAEIRIVLPRLQTPAEQFATGREVMGCQAVIRKWIWQAGAMFVRTIKTISLGGSATPTEQMEFQDLALEMRGTLAPGAPIDEVGPIAHVILELDEHGTLVPPLFSKDVLAHILNSSLVHLNVGADSYAKTPLRRLRLKLANNRQAHGVL
jgi:hypothetical protein